MKKYSTLKRLAAAAVSAMMIFTSFSAVFAEGEATTATMTVEKERILFGQVNGSQADFKGLYETGINSGINGLTIGDDAEKTVTLENHTSTFNPTYRIPTKDQDGNRTDLKNVKAVMKDYDKYIFNFDVWSSSENVGTTSGYASMIFRGNQVDGKDNDIFNMKIWKDHLKFDYIADKGLNDERWYNIKLVVYLPEDGVANPGTKVQVYVDDRLYGEKTTTLSLDYLIPEKSHLTGGAQTTLKIKNIKLYLANDATISVNDAVYKEEVLDKVDKDAFKVSTGSNLTNIFKRDANTTTITPDGITFTSDREEGPYVIFDNGSTEIKKYFEGTDKELYRDYTLSYDVKIPISASAAPANTKLQEIRFLTPNVDNGHQYFGYIGFYPNKIRFQNGFDGAWKEISNNSEKVHIDMRIKPSTDKTVAPHVTWYLNGKNVHEGALNIAQANTSLYGFIKNIYGFKQANENYRIAIDNVKLSVAKKSAHPIYAFKASASKIDDSLNVVFDKDVANGDYIRTDNIAVKDNKGTAVTASSVSYNAENKTATIALPENSNSEWYSVEFTDILTSTDGVYLANNVVSTPHIEVVKSAIKSDDAVDGKYTLDVTYHNTLTEPQNVMAVIAAYDSNNRLINVDVKQYDVAAGEFTPSGANVPTITETGAASVQAYIWGASNKPMCGVIPSN